MDPHSEIADPDPYADQSCCLVIEFYPFFDTKLPTKKSSKCRPYGNAILTASDHAEFHAFKTNRLMISYLCLPVDPDPAL